MKYKVVLALAILFFLGYYLLNAKEMFVNYASAPASLHDFTVEDLAGNLVSLNQYAGKVVLVVNTASECGFTPQYAELETLYNLYKDRGFVVLAFPSNDFGGQEPLKGAEIQQFCEKNYGVSFPVFQKISVKNGNDQHPLFQFLSSKKLNGKINSNPKWNFHKYLIDKEGHVQNYYYSTTSPTANRLKKAIENLL